MLLAWVCHGQQAPSFDNVPTTELRARVESLLLSKRHAELIPPLTEYLKRLEEASDPKTADEMERLTFTLAYCYFADGKHEEAVGQFHDYLGKYEEKNITRTGLALDILANLLFSQGKYDEAAPLLDKIIARRHTPPDRVREARALLIECHVLPGRWETAIPLLEAAVKDKTDLDLYGRSVVYLCQGYVETDQVERVFELLPELEQSGSVARYSVAFNIALLKGADRMFEAGRYDLALPLFLTVAPKRLIETWLVEQSDLARGRREAARGLPGEAGAAAALAANDRLRRLEAEQKLLSETKSYDEELRHRIAQAYFKQSRTWEALWVYESIIEDFGDSTYGEEAAYAGFALAASLGLLERAADFGIQYIERYPEGKYYDDVSHQLAHIYLEMRRFPDVLRLARAVLEARPDSLFADRLLFLTGFSLFQEEKFDEAAEMFAEVRRRYPQSEVLPEAEYWRAMTFLFRADYPRALELFNNVASSHPQTIVGVDAKFRAAVCLYALEKYSEAGRQLAEFVKNHPRSPQVAEARNLLGDIAGGEGRLDEALAHYRAVEALTLNQSTIDYAALQIARVLETLEKYAEMEKELRSYLEKYGTGGMYAEAIYRIGFAQKMQGDTDGMLQTYREAIRAYGNDRKAIGIDMILRDYIREYTQRHGRPPEEEARAELAGARARQEPALVLRWQHALDQIATTYHIGQRPKLELKSELLDNASAATMVWIGRLARENGNNALALEAFERSLTEFPDSEWNEPALLELARMARDAGDTEAALAHYKQLYDTFPSSESAAVALEEQALLLMARGRNREAVDLLELILEVKEWRGEIWARALYHIGEARLAMGETAEAFAYFQRVYVLYSGYPEWAAKAYLQSAKCLRILGKESERLATLREFVSNEDFQALPEYAVARELLAAGGVRAEAPQTQPAAP